MVVHDPHKPLPQDARVTDLTRLAAMPLFRPLGLVARGKLLESGRILAGPSRETMEGPAALVVALDGEAEIHSRYLETADGPSLARGPRLDPIADAADARAIPLCHLSAGEHSPLHACFDESARAQTLILPVGARALVLSRAALEPLMDAHPRLGQAVALHLARRLRALNEGLRDALDLGLAGGRDWRHALAAAKYRELYSTCPPASRRVQRFLKSAHYRNPALWIFLGFILAVMFSRLVVGTILAYGLEKRFFRLIQTDDAAMIHIHHFNYGLALLLCVALVLLFPRARRYLPPLAAVYGFGLGLFMDEIGLVTSLSPDYFQAASGIGIVVTTAALIWLIYYFGRRGRERP